VDGGGVLVVDRGGGAAIGLAFESATEEEEAGAEEGMGGVSSDEAAQAVDGGTELVVVEGGLTLAEQRLGGFGGAWIVGSDSGEVLLRLLVVAVGEQGARVSERGGGGGEGRGVGDG